MRKMKRKANNSHSFPCPRLPGPCSRFQPRFGRPRSGDDEGRSNFNQLHLPSSEPRADGHAVPEEGHRPGYGPGAPSHHRPRLWCTELHGKHRRVCTQCLRVAGSGFQLIDSLMLFQKAQDFTSHGRCWWIAVVGFVVPCHGLNHSTNMLVLYWTSHAEKKPFQFQFEGSSSRLLHTVC